MRKRVGIVMGSDSDLPVMRQAAAALDALEISYEVRIISAHRTPEQAAAYAREAEGRGLEVLIAGAGGAAHLAGVLAAHTVLPVIGVPVNAGALHGWDALLATVQMPPGVPVATVAVNGAKNAAILAAQIIATGDAAVRERLHAFKEKMASEVAAKNEKLDALGIEGYLKEKFGN
ncbi:MAG: 5-(carboxyamino)imidazole ribonucleotide mutase [Peptococcaceae bacterium]|nr:5-(carboxyamino)imidazole ribonucleotide mutase [Peptococcaceae bacterium]